MDLYGMSEALSQANSFAQHQGETHEAVRQHNQDIDKEINDAKNVETEQEQGISSEQMQKDENTLMGQVASGIGLKGVIKPATITKSAKQVENVVKQATDIPKVPLPSDPEFANVNAVVDNENLLAKGTGSLTAELESGLGSVVKKGGGIVADSSKLLGGAGALIGGGMALQQDIAGGVKGFEKMNWEDKLGNMLSIAGSTAELTGIAVPTPASLGLEVAGGLASLVGGVFSEIGGAIDEKTQKAQAQSKQAIQTAKLQGEKMAPKSTVGTGSFGGIAGASFDSSKLITGSGSF
jgi:hypothetical protein